MKCCGCQRDEEQIDLEVTPCCEKKICFDFCLYDHLAGDPFKCPGCDKEIMVFYADYDVDQDYPELRVFDREGRKAALMRIKKVVEHFFTASPHELLSTDLDVLDELIEEAS